jgi:hypothetical protein
MINYREIIKQVQGVFFQFYIYNTIIIKFTVKLYYQKL